MASARADRRVHQRARRDELVAARLNWKLLVAFGGTAAIVSIGLVVEYDSRAVSYLSGLYLGLFLAGLWAIVLDHTGVSLRRAEVYAEGWTASVLAKAAKEGWQVRRDVPFEDAEVEAIAVTDTCVLAIRTRWGTSWGGRYGWQRRIRALRDARWVAKKTTDLLTDAGIAIEARAVIVVWGPGATSSADEAGVAVVRGGELAGKLVEMAAAGAWAIEVDRALAAIDAHLARRAEQSTAA